MVILNTKRIEYKFKMNLFAVLGCLLLSWTDALVIENSNLKTERDLKRDLFENYDKQVRPIKDPHAAMELQVSLSPIMIRDVDVKHQSLALDSWMLMKWHDDYLTWDPEAYNDIKILRVPSTEIWKPDLALYSASSAENLFPMAITQALLYFNGTVLWVPMQTLNSRCPFFKQADKSYFDCNIKMGSWTYSAKEVNPQLLGSGLDVSNFYDINPDWKLVEFTANRESKYYPCCPGEDYPNINFNITLKGRSKEEYTFGY